MQVYQPMLKNVFTLWLKNMQVYYLTTTLLLNMLLLYLC